MAMTKTTYSLQLAKPKMFHFISLLFLGCGNIVENLNKGNIENSVALAKEMNKDEINEKYDATILTIGSQKGTKIGIRGDDAENVYSGISVFPNPATEFIKIKADNINFLRLLNSAGIVIFENNYYSENEVIIDINELASGLYFVNIETDEGVGFKKLLVR